MDINYKSLSICVCILLILWIYLLYLQNTHEIKLIKETFRSNIYETFVNSNSNSNNGDNGGGGGVYDYQTGLLNKNYNEISELDQNLDTQGRLLEFVNQEGDALNKTAYIFKYITIISISLLILMICIFVLNFDDLRGPSALARRKVREFVNSVKSNKAKNLV
jgi:hypothetical protein